MLKNMLIDSAHLEEIRVAIVEGEKLDRFESESQVRSPIKGNIYLAKVIRVEPALQAAFVEYGGGRHGFLSIGEIHHDYFQIPVGDREGLNTHLQNAMDTALDQDIDEENTAREISKLRYQFYKRYKIQEVIKKRQIMLVQVIKEERGNKCAALTTYISLAGRHCVLMPNTTKGSGVSRKITEKSARDKLKNIVSSLIVENGSVVIRTAGIGRTKAEIKKDFDYLMKLWNEIRNTTLHSTAPCLIYEEASLIKRMIRDYFTKEIDSIIVEGEEGYKIAKDFVKRLSPRSAKNVKLYEDTAIPLFYKFNINEQINQIYSTRVDLPSGGYLVINSTEALISIDVNSGKAIRERNVAGTALRTNLEAAVEISKQCRLRDLAGLIVVDFIDMEEKKNNSQVERCLRDALKSDKAKIQVGNISVFGLLEFSRQRLRSSIADSSTVTCPHCRGTGMLWSDEVMALQILRKIEEASIADNIKEIVVSLSTNNTLYLMNHKRDFIKSIELRGNFELLFRIDDSFSASDFNIEQVFKEKIKELPLEDNDMNANPQRQSSSNKRNKNKKRAQQNLNENSVLNEQAQTIDNSAVPEVDQSSKDSSDLQNTKNQQDSQSSDQKQNDDNAKSKSRKRFFQNKKNKKIEQQKAADGSKEFAFESGEKPENTPKIDNTNGNPLEVSSSDNQVLSTAYSKKKIYDKDVNIVEFNKSKQNDVLNIVATKKKTRNNNNSSVEEINKVGTDVFDDQKKQKQKLQKHNNNRNNSSKNNVANADKDDNKSHLVGITHELSVFKDNQKITKQIIDSLGDLQVIGSVPDQNSLDPVYKLKQKVEKKQGWWQKLLKKPNVKE